MKQFINTTDLDFLKYRESLKEYLKTQEAFKDYDFEGSNIAILLDILALNTNMNAYYENMIGSEMFLDTALLKDSVVSRSKELNYTPRSRTSSRTTTTFSIDTGGNTPSTVTIPKYYNVKASGFDSNNNVKEYNFVTNTAIVIQPDIFDNYAVEDVEIFQGNAVKEVYVANSTNRYVLQANTIDINSIDIQVQISNTDNTSAQWERSLDIYGLTSESNVFFVQAYNDDRYEITFGNGVIGRSISNNNIIKISYIETDGEPANGLEIFYPTVAIEGYAVTSILSDAKTSGGSERENIESIKFHAPRHFTTQERAVVESDYENLVRIKFPTIQSVLAYGGERLNPPQFGKVAIFLKPFGIEGVVSNALKAQITKYLETKSLTTQTFIVDPEYFYIRIKSKAYYNPDLIIVPVEEIRKNIIDALFAFGQEQLTDFDSDLRYSKLIKMIDDVNDALVSNDTTLSLIKKWAPLTGSVQKLNFSFGTPLKKYTNITREIENGIDPTITSSVFSYVLNGVSYAATIEDNGLGILKIIANNTAKNVLNSNIGTVNYDSGEINLSANISSYSNKINIYATTLNKDLTVSENRYLLLDKVDITIEVLEAIE